MSLRHASWRTQLAHTTSNGHYNGVLEGGGGGCKNEIILTCALCKRIPLLAGRCDIVAYGHSFQDDNDPRTAHSHKAEPHLNNTEEYSIMTVKHSKQVAEWDRMNPHFYRRIK